MKYGFEKVIFNLGVFLCLAVGLGTMLGDLPVVLQTVGSIVGLLMVGTGYAMMRRKGNG